MLSENRKPKYRCDHIIPSHGPDYGSTIRLIPVDTPPTAPAMSCPVSITTADPLMIAKFQAGREYAIDISPGGGDTTKEPYLPDRINNY
jgi:hypothetical protein